jgi:hypothetical protein
MQTQALRDFLLRSEVDSVEDQDRGRFPRDSTKNSAQTLFCHGVQAGSVWATHWL